MTMRLQSGPTCTFAKEACFSRLKLTIFPFARDVGRELWATHSTSSRPSKGEMNYFRLIMSRSAILSSAGYAVVSHSWSIHDHHIDQTESVKINYHLPLQGKSRRQSSFASPGQIPEAIITGGPASWRPASQPRAVASPVLREPNKSTTANQTDSLAKT